MRKKNKIRIPKINLKIYFTIHVRLALLVKIDGFSLAAIRVWSNYVILVAVTTGFVYSRIDMAF